MLSTLNAAGSYARGANDAMRGRPFRIALIMNFDYVMGWEYGKHYR